MDDAALSATRRTRAGDSPDRVYEALRRRIIDQSLKPGTRLAEDDVAGQYEVSRTVVRAALERLVSEGLVERPPNRSARVASIGLEAAADLLDVRQGVEAMVMQRLAGRLTPAQAAELQSHVRREERASSLNQPEAVRLAGEFHLLLAQATGSATLARYVADLISRSSLVIASHGLPHSSSCAVREHLELIDLLAAGDVQGAQDSMRRHLNHIAGRAHLGESEP